MNSKLKLFAMALFGIIALCTPVSAQYFRGTFTLNHGVCWGTTHMQPGSYMLETKHFGMNHLIWVYSSDLKQSLLFNAPIGGDDPKPGRSFFTVVTDPATGCPTVASLNLPDLRANIIFNRRIMRETQNLKVAEVAIAPVTSGQ